jgi:oligopeptide transport system substrate-binding protein
MAYEEGFIYWQRASKARSHEGLPAAPHPLRVATLAPPTLDPGFVDDTTSGSFVDQMFSGLIELAPDLTVVPNVARSWDVLEDGRKYRFHLRRDARWSDGQPVTAADFEYAWKRVLDPTTDSPASKYLLDIRGAAEFNRAGASADAIAVLAADEHTLIVELEQPTGYFLQLLQVAAFFPVPRHVVKPLGLDWSHPAKIVTNGPFRPRTWNKQGAILERNPEYHGRFEGNVEEVQMIFRESAEGELYRLYEDDLLDVQFLFTLSPEDQDRSRQSHASEYLTAPVLGMFYLGFDVSRPPFDDVRVRRAFAQAIDREALAEIVLRGYYTPATGSMVPPGLPGHAADSVLVFDPVAARRLMDEAGYGNEREFPPIECLCAAHSTASLVGETIQDQWSEHLGAAVVWDSLEWTSYLERLRKRLPNIWMMGWGADYPDPDTFMRLAIWDRAVQVWQNEHYIELVESARRSLDHTERMQLYARAQQILSEEVPVLPLLYHRGHLLLKPWIAEYPLSPMRWDYWKDVIIEPHD